MFLRKATSSWLFGALNGVFSSFSLDVVLVGAGGSREHINYELEVGNNEAAYLKMIKIFGGIFEEIYV